MSNEASTTALHGARIARAAWLVSFVVPAVLLLLLVAAKPSAAITVSPPLTESTVELEEEGEGEEAGEEVEVEEEEEEEFETGPYPPEECLLRSAHARAVARHRRLKLTVGYTAYEPVDARVEIRSGGVQIESVRRHLGRSGVLRITKKLGEQPKAKRLVLRFLISGCDSFQSRTIRIH